ncbi:hypothetical protein [Achromobacter xylosoxidans]|uniref:hypothetical protein n=1 Tax=Alcaligenes xylosoxydans xylosoxydans TaxID=85698 RepID=UPI001EEAD005|nr:hypothetical protein [Achromobacter xylosoxidans]
MGEQQQPTTQAEPAFDQHALIFLEAYREQAGRADSWGLEALRNLILVNAAGIAGTITAYQINAISRAIAPAACFLLGLGLAFAAIALGWFMHRLVANEYQQNAARYKESRDPRHLFKLNDRLYRRISNFSVAIGVLSLCLFVAGSAYLVDLVRQPPAIASEQNSLEKSPSTAKTPHITEDPARPD